MSTPITYLQRQSNAGVALANTLSEQSTKALSEAAEAKEGAYKNTFRGSGRPSSNAFRAKQLALKENTATLKDALMVTILRESMPFNLEHVTDEQLSESIKSVEKRYSNFLNERVLVQPEGMPNGLDVNSPASLNLCIGSVNGATPFKIARAAIVASANICTSKKLDVTVSCAYNAVDTAFVRGETECTEDSVGREFKAYMSSLIQKVGSSIGREVRSRLGASLREEAERNLITEEDRLFGLSEAAAERERHAIRKERRSEFHLMEEVYKCIRTLDETKGASDEDYLNEAAFHVGIIHAYSLLEAVTMNTEEIAMELRRLRKV